jgi:hypothetical protein
LGDLGDFGYAVQPRSGAHDNAATPHPSIGSDGFHLKDYQNSERPGTAEGICAAGCQEGPGQCCEVPQVPQVPLLPGRGGG